MRTTFKAAKSISNFITKAALKGKYSLPCSIVHLTYSAKRATVSTRPRFFMNFWHLFDIKVGGDSLDLVIDVWREEGFDVDFVRLFVGTGHEVPSESGIQQG